MTAGLAARSGRGHPGGRRAAVHTLQATSAAWASTTNQMTRATGPARPRSARHLSGNQGR